MSVRNAWLNLTTCRMSGNSSARRGGGIAARTLKEEAKFLKVGMWSLDKEAPPYCTLQLASSEVMENTAQQEGGGLAIWNALAPQPGVDFAVQGTVFKQNMSSGLTSCCIYVGDGKTKEFERNWIRRCLIDINPVTGILLLSQSWGGHQAIELTGNGIYRNTGGGIFAAETNVDVFLNRICGNDPFGATLAPSKANIQDNLFMSNTPVQIKVALISEAEIHHNDILAAGWESGLVSATGIDVAGNSYCRANMNNIFGHSTLGATKAAGTIPGTATMNATNNYWGSQTGPSHSTNPTGQGDPISNNVLFVPYEPFLILH